MQFDSKASEAVQKLMKKARECTKAAVLSFRFKPDWDGCARYSKEAADSLRRYASSSTEATMQLLEALDLAATAHENINALNHAATLREEIGDVNSKLAEAYTEAGRVSRANDRTAQAVDAYQASSRFFRLNNQTERSAALLTKAAKAADAGGDRAQCVQLLLDACAVYEDEAAPTHADHTFKTALAFILKTGDIEAALKLLPRQNAIYAKKLSQYKHDLHQSYLSEVILLLALKQWAKAEAALERLSGLHGFGSSEEYDAGERLIAAMEGTQEEVDLVLKKSSIKFIDNAVARVAYKLQARNVRKAGAGAGAGKGKASLDAFVGDDDVPAAGAGAGAGAGDDAGAGADAGGDESDEEVDLA